MGCASAYKRTYNFPKNGFTVYEVEDHDVQRICSEARRDDYGALIPYGTHFFGCTIGDEAWVSIEAPKCTWLHEICHLLQEDHEVCAKICQNGQ